MKKPSSTAERIERQLAEDVGIVGVAVEEQRDAAPLRSSDRRIGDEAVADAVRRDLREDALTTDLPIEVDVLRSVVTLRGQMRDVDDAEHAQSVAARVPGVADVVDELRVPEA